MKATLLFLLGSLVGETGEAFASPADDAATAGLLGTYECSTGSTAVVVPTQPVHVDQYEKSNPLLRLTIASTSRVDVLWWNKDKQDWKDDPSTDLKVKQIDVKEKFWAVTLEGSFGRRIGTAVSGYLSSFAGLGQSGKPTLVLTQTSPLFASASALQCEKL